MMAGKLGGLEHPGPKQFEVAAFEAVGINRVINARTGAIEKLEPALLAVGSLDHVALEILVRKQTRARACDEDAAGFEEGNGKQVEVFVFLTALPVAGIKI